MLVIETVFGIPGSSCLVSTPSGLSLLCSPELPPAAAAGSLVRAPPFFRTSAGHRVEGRNPWHLQCSRNQLRAGTLFRRLVRSLSLRPSSLLASWADQTGHMLSLPQAFTSGIPALKSPRGLPDITTAPNGELRRQDFHLQVQQLVSLRSLQWVPWDVGSPPSSVLCSAKTANGPPRGRSVLPLLPRSLGVAPLALCPLVSQGSCERRALPFHAGSLAHAGRHSCA